jgi:ubiquinone/menaquinone biosynthesis C-methylase UbiE
VPSAAAGALPDALDRAAALLGEELRADGGLAARARRSAGYLDLLPPEGPASTGRAQDLMLSRLLPAVYERWWRPAWTSLATGVLGPSARDEQRIARLLLGLVPGDGVLDVACGPGNFTRELARVVGPAGLAIGLDASPTMLARAVAETDPAALPAAGYVRGDAEHLPFRDASFDAVLCFAALYLMGDPVAALREMHRVLAPGGRIAVMTSCRTQSAPLRLVDGVAGRLGAIRMFERDEVTGVLKDLGMADVTQRVTGFAQFVGARRPRGGGDG